MVTREMILTARNANLLAYLHIKGYDIIRSGKNEYRLAEHDSLVISNNKWHWKSRDIGGNTLDFLIKYEKQEFEESVRSLYDTERQPYAYTGQFTKKEYKERSGGKNDTLLILPEKNSNHRRAFAYLNKSRAIDSEILAEMLHQGKLFESKRHNCVFLGKDTSGAVRYAAERGTLTEKAFRKECDGSDKRFSFSMEGSSCRLYVFESPIDALSHATIYKITGEDYRADHRLSLGGVESLALEQYLRDHEQVTEIILCLDNDSVGLDASVRIAELLASKGYKVNRETPRYKDFNDDLIALRRCGGIYEGYYSRSNRNRISEPDPRNIIKCDRT